jgi:hypothetical protein
VRLQSSHCRAARGLDAYFSPREATAGLLAVEGESLPCCIWEPAAERSGAGNPASCGAPREEAAMQHSLSAENEIGI